MLKRIAIWILVISMLLSAAAGALAAGYDNLWNKLKNQIVMGSGLELEFSFTGEEGSLLRTLGLDLDGAAGTFTYVHDQVNHNLYELKGTIARDNALGKEFVLQGSDDAHLLTASWLETPVSIARNTLENLFTANQTEKELVEALFVGDDEEWTEDVIKAGDDYRLQLETWLSEYAEISDVVDGRMTIRYAIPAADLKTEIASLFEKLLQDDDLLKLLSQRLSAETVERYLDPRWASQYVDILTNMPLTDELVITRVQNVMGEVESTHLAFPIPGAMSEYGKTFTCQVDDLNWHLGLIGESNTFIFTWNKKAQADTASGELVLELQEMDLKLKAGFECAWSTQEWVDEKEREHESLLVELKVTDRHEDADDIAFEPITLTYEDELRSKNTNVSATYIKKGLVTLTMGEHRDCLSFTGQSASPWRIKTADASSARPIDTAFDLIFQVLSNLNSFLN